MKHNETYICKEIASTNSRYQFYEFYCHSYPISKFQGKMKRLIVGLSFLVGLLALPTANGDAQYFGIPQARLV